MVEKSLENILGTKQIIVKNKVLDGNGVIKTCSNECLPQA